MIIILTLMISTSKNKNIDHQDKEICSDERNHISLLCDLMILSALIFCFLSTLLQPPKEKIKLIRKKINTKEKNVYIRNEYYYYFFICQNLGLVNLIQQTIKLSSPYLLFYILCTLLLLLLINCSFCA